MVLTQTTNGNGFNRGGDDADFFSQKPVSDGQQHLLTDDIFSLDTPASQINTNTFSGFNPSAPPRRRKMKFYSLY